ncbi:MAG TPA: hypothetical protein VMB03_34495 [Bryobacteraceae bacterium]|nr:hypothetical protein [Bryobacteraceae bacterium]
MADPKAPDQELHTWAEIAGYLGISPREAQYRETNEGLPVYRLKGKKSRVWARRSELDAWKEKMVAVNTPPNPAMETSGAGSGVNRRWILAGLGGALALSAGAVVIRRLETRKPARFGFQGNSICAWDEVGRLLWSFPFPQPMDPDPAGGLPPGNHQMVTADLGANGSEYAVATPAFLVLGQVDRAKAYCFSPEGRLVWSYIPDLKFTFGDTVFSGPWLAQDLAAVASAAGRSSVWISYTHLDYRPCALVSFTLKGVRRVEFVNTGHIHTLAYLSNASGRYVLAGGLNNEYNKAALAILRPDGPPSCSPQTAGTRFHCVGGPMGQPYRYFLFPPTDVNVASALPYNRIRVLHILGNRVSVHSYEDGSGEAGAIYTFSPDLEPEEVILTDGFGLWHRRLEKQGLIRHDLAHCPHLNEPTIVDRWDPRHGWSKVSVPPSRSVKPGSLR